MAKKQHEQKIKRMILDWLALQHRQHAFVWINSSTGIYSGGQWRKANSPHQMTGTSDVLGIWKGRPLAIEVKTPELRNLFKERISKRTSPREDQLAFLTRFAEMGGIAIVARSLDDAANALRDADLHPGRGRLYLHE